MVCVNGRIVKRSFRAYNKVGVKIWRGTLEDEEKYMDFIAIHHNWSTDRRIAVAMVGARPGTIIFDENVRN